MPAPVLIGQVVAEGILENRSSTPWEGLHWSLVLGEVGVPVLSYERMCQAVLISSVSESTRIPIRASNRQETCGGTES